VADVLRRAEFAFRDRVAHLLQVYLAEVVEAAGRDVAWQDGIDRD
jgi:hypothetical protein